VNGVNYISYIRQLSIDLCDLMTNVSFVHKYKDFSDYKAVYGYNFNNGGFRGKICMCNEIRNL